MPPAVTPGDHSISGLVGEENRQNHLHAVPTGRVSKEHRSSTHTAGVPEDEDSNSSTTFSWSGSGAGAPGLKAKVTQRAKAGEGQDRASSSETDKCQELVALLHL